MEPINKKGPVDHLYGAGLKGKEIYLYASSLAAAKQTAINYFRPKKREVNLIWVVLADQPIDPASL